MLQTNQEKTEKHPYGSYLTAEHFELPIVLNLRCMASCMLFVGIYAWQLLSKSIWQRITNWIFRLIVFFQNLIIHASFHTETSCLRGLTGITLDHRSVPPQFESQLGHIWRLFHLWLCFISFGSRSAHLAYHVHKSGRKTSIIVFLLRDFNMVYNFQEVGRFPSDSDWFTNINKKLV